MLAQNQKGQAMLEYVLLLTIIVMLVGIVVRGLGDVGLGDLLLRPLREDFAYTYRYGDPKTRGYDDGDPVRHPRIHTQGEGGVGGNFRMFINQP